MIKKSEKIVRKLIYKKIKISFAESCTGGMLSSILTSIPGSSKVFTLGVVAYSNKSKIEILKISKMIIKKYGAVSEEVCRSMLKNISKIGKTNMSISVTGIAGPKGGSKKKPVGLVYIGIKKGNKTMVKKFLFKSKKRNSIQRSTVNNALNLVLSFVK